MSSENATLEKELIELAFSEEAEEEEFDFEALEEKLQSQLEEDLNDLDFLREEGEKIGNPDHLGEVIKGVVWEQFMNQIAEKAGTDFIRENNGMTLDLRDSAHIQTTENFEKGKIATHNTEIDYQERHDDWMKNFQKNEDGSVKTRIDPRTGKEVKVLNKDARKPFDKGRPTGSASKNTDMDHIISAAEIIRDPAAAAHLSKEEQVAFANSKVNLNEMPKDANQSKGDSPMEPWLDSERDGKKPEERFDIDANELREKDKKAREGFNDRKDEGEERSKKEGRKSQRKEAFRISGAALRAAAMQLLAELAKEIIAKLVSWFKTAKRTLSTLLEGIKEAIHNFVGKLKTHLINAGNTALTTVVTAIVGPVWGSIKKVWMILKQGWQSLKNAVAYLRDPANKGKPIGRLLMETGKIVIAGMTGVSAIVLGEVIEKGLMAIPGIGAVFAFENPLIGSLANILGMLLGAIVAGIIGAVAINMIEKRVAKGMQAEASASIIQKGNEVLMVQHQLQAVTEIRMQQAQAQTEREVKDRHAAAAQVMRNSLENIENNLEEDRGIDEKLDSIDQLFSSLED